MSFTITKTSEHFLVATADCPECLSKKTLFQQFRGHLIRSDESKPAEGIRILAEVHKCQDCSFEFEKNDGPWINLTLAAWGEAMKHSLSFDRVIHYTNYIRQRSEEQ